MIRCITAFVLSFLIFTGLHSCKKNEDDHAPSIIINSPIELSTFNVPENIPVSFNATDETILTSVSITLLNENFISVLPTQSFTPGKNTFSTTLNYPLSDPHLKSGTYYISIRATDGKNSTQAYRKIYVNASPTLRKGVYVVTQRSLNSCGIIQIDSGITTATDVLFLSGDYNTSCINNYYGYLMIGGKNSGNVNTIDLNTNQIKWAIQNVISAAPYFSNTYTHNAYNLVSYQSPLQLKIYNTIGAQIMNVNFPQDKYPEETFIHNQFIIAEQKQIASNTKKIKSIYLNTGASNTEIAISCDIIRFYSYDNSRIFVFGNNGSKGELYLYDLSSNSLTQPHQLNGSKIRSVVQLNTDTYLLSMGDNYIYSYQYSINSFLPFKNETAYKMDIDSVNNELFIAGAYSIKSIDINSKQTLKQLSFSDSILNVHVWMNK